MQIRPLRRSGFDEVHPEPNSQLHRGMQMFRPLRLLLLTICSITPALSFAGSTNVSIVGDQLSFYGGTAPFAGTVLTIDFSVPDLVPGAFSAESESAFTISNVPTSIASDIQSIGGTATEIGWFYYADLNYSGIDIRYVNLFTPGDLLQLIISTPIPLFSGATSAPTLILANLNNLYSRIYYNSNQGPDAQGSMANTIYAAVPEPSMVQYTIVGMLAFGVIFWKRRNRSRGFCIFR